MRQRGLLVLLAAVALSGCGSQASAPAEEPGLEPAPSIQAVDEPAPEAWEAGFELDMVIPPECEQNPDECTAGGDGCFRASNRPGEEESWGGECTPEEIKRIMELVRAEAKAYDPALDSERRVVARLQLTGPERVDVIAWRTEEGKLCFVAESHPNLGSSSAMGPCQPHPACLEICIAAVDTFGLTFAGTVSPKGDEILFTLNDGHTRRFPLVGPLVPGFDQRIFMVHLGQKTVRRIQLFRKDEPIAEHVRPAEDVRFEDCSKRFDADDAAFQTCVDDTPEPPAP